MKIKVKTLLIFKIQYIVPNEISSMQNNSDNSISLRPKYTILGQELLTVLKSLFNPHCCHTFNGVPLRPCWPHEPGLPLLLTTKVKRGSNERETARMLNYNAATNRAIISKQSDYLILESHWYIGALLIRYYELSTQIIPSILWIAMSVSSNNV